MKRPETVEIWEDAETWRRIASMWSKCYARAERRCLLELTWEKMPKTAAYLGSRGQGQSGPVSVEGTRDGWGILTGWLCNVGWRQVVNQHGGQVFSEQEQKWANELGHRLIVGTSICEAFRESDDVQS